MKILRVILISVTTLALLAFVFRNDIYNSFYTYHGSSYELCEDDIADVYKGILDMEQDFSMIYDVEDMLNKALKANKRAYKDFFLQYSNGKDDFLINNFFEDACLYYLKRTKLSKQWTLRRVPAIRLLLGEEDAGNYTCYVLQNMQDPTQQIAIDAVAYSGLGIKRVKFIEF
jgi:hypothetical protein